MKNLISIFLIGMLQMQPEEEVSFGVHLIDKNEGPSLIIPPNIANQVIIKEETESYLHKKLKWAILGGWKRISHLKSDA